MLSNEDKKFLTGVFSTYDYIMTTSQLKEEKLYYGRKMQNKVEQQHK